MRTSHRRYAFSLVECLVVIGIASVLMALLAPAVMRVRETANAVKCANNLRQIGVAVHAFENAHGVLPRCWGGFPDRNPVPPNFISGSLFHMLLPYLDQVPLFRSSYNQEISPNGWYDWTRLEDKDVRTYICPSDPLRDAVGTGNYVANERFFPRFGDHKYPKLNLIPDGLSATVMITEAASNIRQASRTYERPWAGEGAMYLSEFVPERLRVTQPPSAMYAAGTAHSALAVCMGDGSVDRLALDLERAKWIAYSLPDDGR